MTFDLIEQLNTERQLLQQTFGKGQDSEKKTFTERKKKKVPVEETKNIIRQVHFDYNSASVPPILIPKEAR